MKNQKDLIQGENQWHVLIILDACRYDFFYRNYLDFLEGNLEKVKSEGSSTQPWLRKTFDDRMNNTVYVSGTPYCNSKGVDFIGFDGKKYFYKVVDCWEDGWDDELWTVRPETISKKARFARARYSDKKLIIHFLQPHDPYIGYEPTRERPNWIKVLKGEKNTGGIIQSKTPIHSLLNVIRNFLGLKKNPIEKFVEKYDRGTLIKAYEKNLRLALREVKKLVSRLPDKKIIVTADHGELLGENGKYRHPTGSDNPILREVPWLEVEK